MKGQWIGSYTGTNRGVLVVEIEDRLTHYDGIATAYNTDTSAPGLRAHFSEIPKDKSVFPLSVSLEAIQRLSGHLYSSDGFKQEFPDLAAPTSAATIWNVTDEKITINWKTNVETNGMAELYPSKGGTPSQLKSSPEVVDWATFKNYVMRDLEPYRFLFRGQENNQWRLRTSFHRSGRANLMRYMVDDVTVLFQQLSGLTTHRFDLSNNFDYAAFLSLVQHHGFPTPLLDWTRSPFIAAYFAFNDLTQRQAATNQKVRIHMLDARGWNLRFEQAGVMAPGFLHLTILEPLAINNPRAIPQQAASTVTNLDDLETYIEEREKAAAVRFLAAFDMPASERDEVLRELNFMGINAGSLFPGLDGACKQLRQRFFPS